MSDSDWPSDYNSAVFLRRAVMRVGAARCDGWRETDLLAGPTTPLSDEPTASFEINRMHIILAEDRPELGLPTPPTREQARREAPLITPSPEIVMAAHTAIDRRNEEARRAMARVQAAADELTRACEAGDLLSYFYDTGSGQLEEISPQFWRGRTSRRYRTWKFDRHDPLERHESIFGGDWVYVERLGLEAILARLEANADMSSPWYPDRTIACKHWCIREAPRAEARRRLTEAGVAITRKRVAGALARMWAQAHREGGTSSTIDTYLNNAGIPS